jgi:hypothetical protein
LNATADRPPPVVAPMKVNTDESGETWNQHSRDGRDGESARDEHQRRHGPVASALAAPGSWPGPGRTTPLAATIGSAPLSYKDKTCFALPIVMWLHRSILLPH